MPSKRVWILSNKWWETDPLCGVLIHDRARPSSFTNFRYVRYPAPRLSKPKTGDPRPPDPKSEPRMVFDCGDASVEVWCLEELMNPAENSSSSREKARVLAAAIQKVGIPDLMIAFGTAGSRPGVSANGSAVIGRRVFIHDPRAEQDHNNLWRPPLPDQLIDSAFPVENLRQLDEQARYAAEARLLRAPIDPDGTPRVLLGNGFMSLGVVNIISYDDYVWADSQAVAAFMAKPADAQIGSIETTHGIIRSASQAPFLFVSGITDTEGLFDYQVSPRVYAQNFVAAHNAAVAVAWLLPGIVGTL